MTAKLSIIVPVYNVEKYLAGCLDSLLAQTLKDIEIICVDDGSTDNSPEILKQYAQKDERIRIVTKENGGLSSARNAGLDVTTTEFITFIDSDDYVSSNTYELALSKMTDDIDLVHFGIQSIGTQDPQKQKNDDDYYRIKFEGKTEITTDLMLAVDVSSCNKIFRKSILDKYNIRFPNGLKHEDAYFFNAYTLNAKYCFYIKDKLYYYIRHDGSIMAQVFSNTPGSSIDHLKIAIKVYEYMTEHNLFDKYKRYFAEIFFAYFDFAMRYEHTAQGQSDIYDLATNFLNVNKLSFSDYPECKTKQHLILHRAWNGETRNRLNGIVCIKTRGDNRRISFAGIPILRVKYCADKTRYYPFALFCLYEKKFKRGAE